MLDKYQNLKEQFESGEALANNARDAIDSATEKIHSNVTKMVNQYDRVSIIISDIDKQFAEKTGINNTKDMIILWSAVAVQCIRWMLIPTINKDMLSPSKEGRKPASSEGKKDKTATKKQLDRNKADRDNRKFPNKNEIMFLPVPFDAMLGTEDIIIPGVTEYGKNINGHNHHAATLGHDPIVGQAIGTMNILTRTITFHDSLVTTRRVGIPSGRTQIVLKEPYSVIQMISESIDTCSEDIKRLPTALGKENLHLLSDKFTKNGLPFPFLSANIQQYLIKHNWNSAELEKIIKNAGKGIALNFVLAAIINALVGILHGFCYDENCDGDMSLYNVRTRKIVATSNTIAESINLGAVAGGSVVGVITENPKLIKSSISHLDLGGMLEAIHQIVKSQKLQEQIRREFLEQELFNMFAGNKYSFLEESCHE